MHEYFADSTADLQTVAAELKNQKRKHDANVHQRTHWHGQHDARTWRHLRVIGEAAPSRDWRDVWRLRVVGEMYEERSVVLIWMNEHPRCDRLRGDPRFRQLLREIGFKE